MLFIGAGQLSTRVCKDPDSVLGHVWPRIFPCQIWVLSLHLLRVGPAVGACGGIPGVLATRAVSSLGGD